MSFLKLYRQASEATPQGKEEVLADSISRLENYVKETRGSDDVQIIPSLTEEDWKAIRLPIGLKNRVVQLTGSTGSEGPGPEVGVCASRGVDDGAKKKEDTEALLRFVMETGSRINSQRQEFFWPSHSCVHLSPSLEKSKSGSSSTKQQPKQRELRVQGKDHMWPKEGDDRLVVYVLLEETNEATRVQEWHMPYLMYAMWLLCVQVVGLHFAVLNLHSEFKGKFLEDRGRPYLHVVTGKPEPMDKGQRGQVAARATVGCKWKGSDDTLPDLIINQELFTEEKLRDPDWQVQLVATLLHELMHVLNMAHSHETPHLHNIILGLDNEFYKYSYEVDDFWDENEVFLKDSKWKSMVSKGLSRLAECLHNAAESADDVVNSEDIAKILKKDVDLSELNGLYSAFSIHRGCVKVEEERRAYLTLSTCVTNCSIKLDKADVRRAAAEAERLVGDKAAMAALRHEVCVHLNKQAPVWKGVLQSTMHWCPLSIVNYPLKMMPRFHEDDTLRVNVNLLTVDESSQEEMKEFIEKFTGYPFCVPVESDLNAIASMYGLRCRMPWRSDVYAPTEADIHKQEHRCDFLVYSHQFKGSDGLERPPQLTIRLSGRTAKEKRKELKKQADEFSKLPAIASVGNMCLDPKALDQGKHVYADQTASQFESNKLAICRIVAASYRTVPFINTKPWRDFLSNELQPCI